MMFVMVLGVVGGVGGVGIVLVEFFVIMMVFLCVI